MWRNAAEEVFGDLSGATINLQGLRYREGLTQAELGEAIGVDQSNISKMERGTREVSLKIASGEKFIFIHVVAI